MRVLSIKVLIRKKSENLFNDTRIYKRTSESFLIGVVYTMTEMNKE